MSEFEVNVLVIDVGFTWENEEAGIVCLEPEGRKLLYLNTGMTPFWLWTDDTQYA